VTPSLAELQGEMAKRSFHYFFEHFAWPVIQPATKFVDNWHLHAICEHLEAVTDGRIKRLIINVPFRSLKSSIVSQAWPAWEWINKPHVQQLTCSYATDVAVRDAVNTRRIISSEKYQQVFGDKFKLTSDQNVKSRFDNSKSGTRICAATNSAATGFGGSRIILDDPISAKEADSIVAVQAGIEFYKGTVATRLNDAQNDAIVVVHQRLNARDLSGYLLEEEAGIWQHLCIPMHYSAEHTKTTSIGFKDPRQEGELLCPARLNAETVAGMAKALGVYHTHAQLEQRPDSRGGNIFRRNLWKYYKVLPTLDEIVITADCTFKDKDTSDYVAIQAWGRKGADKFLIKRLKDHLGFGATVVALRSFKMLFPNAIAVLIEDKANGSAVIETLTKEIAGIVAIDPEGGKIARAYAIQPEHEAGNIYLPDPSICPEIEEFLSECTSFPTPTVHDDEVDAMTQVINWWRNRGGSMGMFEFYRQQAELLKHKQ
jgi:predicted phage terminase large subunit-like protein